MARPRLNDDTPSDYDDPTPDVSLYAPGQGAYTEPHPHDVDYPEQYEPAPRDWYPDDAASQLQRGRANAHNGSPHVMHRLSCTACQRGATYMGRVDGAPDPTTWRCDRCQ